MDYPATLAMELADVNRQKFNDAVTKGAYPCAPETVRGSRRHFSPIDLVGLAAFGALTNNSRPNSGESLAPRQAGYMACSLVRRLKQGETDLVSLHYVRTPENENLILPYYGDDDRGRRSFNPKGKWLSHYSVNVLAIIEWLNGRLKMRGLEPIEL